MQAAAVAAEPPAGAQALCCAPAVGALSACEAYLHGAVHRQGSRAQAGQGGRAQCRQELTGPRTRPIIR